jgi:hypothetical protein
MDLRKSFSRPMRQVVPSFAVSALEEQRKIVRKLQNRKHTDKAKFKEALTSFNKEIRRLKRQSLVRFIEEIKEKVLSENYTNELGSLLRAEGSLTNDQTETLGTIMLTLFPESHLISEEIGTQIENAWSRSKELIDGEMGHRQIYLELFVKPFESLENLIAIKF